jgi:MoaA/NifB/PqqE/SkfB family radical SAM enzyme
MLTSRKIKVLHLEVTDVCQAACPQCARETDLNFNKNQKNHLTVEMLDQLLPPRFIEDLDKMFMCGVYGDPAAGRHTLEIYEYFRRLNPNIVLGMNSNGAIGNTNWWQRLAKILNHPQDYVVFSIDGLEDTNSIYRVNVDWRKLMDNVRAFISAGGCAHWDMLVYRHNEHQVGACEQLARDMGFQWFRTKVSKRPMQGELQVPTFWKNKSKVIGNIDCHALREQSIYIDAKGRVSPCCWLGGRQFDFVTDFDQIQRSWHSDSPNEICQSTCSVDKSRTNFTSQWQIEVNLV